MKMERGRATVFVLVLVCALLAQEVLSVEVETQETRRRVKNKMSRTERKFNPLSSLKGMLGGATGKVTTMSKMPFKTDGAASKIKPADEKCVICQYLIELARAEMMVNGFKGGMPFAGVPQTSGGQYPEDSADPSSFFPEGTPARTPPPPLPTSPTTPSEGQNMFLELATSQTREPQPATAEIKANENVFGIQVVPQNRDRNIGLLHFRPRQARYSRMYDGPMRADQREQERYENNQIFSVVYQVIEETCALRMPKPFYPFCQMIISNYEKIAQDLRWNDRPDSICMHLDFCSTYSYVAQGPHAVYRATTMPKLPFV